MERRLTAIGMANTLARGLKAVHGKLAAGAMEDLGRDLLDMSMSIGCEGEDNPAIQRRCFRDADFLAGVADRLEDLAAEEEKKQAEAGYDKLAGGWIG